MADETESGLQAEASTPDAPQAEPNPPSNDYETIRKLRAEAKSYRLQMEARDKEFEALKAQVAQTLPNVSKLEQLLEQERQARTEAAAKAAAAERDALRIRVATDAGLPVALASKLSGDTEDELRADAETLKPFIATPPTGPQRPGGSTTPVPGGQPQGETDEQKRSRLLRGNKAGTFWGSKS